MLDERDLKAIGELFDSRIQETETKLTKRIDDVEAKLTERIDGVEKKLDSSVKFLTDAIAEVDANSLRHLNNEISRLDKRLDNMEQSFRIIRLENSQNHEILNILVDHQKRIETLETQMA